MTQITIHLENISLDNKLSGTLKCYVQIDKAQSNFNKNYQESRFETVIVKGKLIIPQKIQIKLVQNEKTVELSQLNQKIYIWFTFQSSNIQPNPLKIHEKQLQISSLRQRDIHMLQYLETKYGRGSMVKYSIKLEKKCRYQKNVAETAASSAENQVNDQLISERIKMRSSDNKYKSWKEISRIKKQNNEKNNNEKIIKGEQINYYKLKQKNLIKNENINENIEQNKRIKNYQPKQKQILNSQQIQNNQLIKSNIQKQYKIKLRAIQEKSAKLQLKIKQLQGHNEQLLKQNIQLQTTIKSYKQIVAHKDEKIKRMNEKIQKLESNIRIKQTMLKQQIQKKINKIKQLSQLNSDNKITVSRLKDDLTQKQRKYSLQVNRLKQLVQNSVKQKRNSTQLTQNYKQNTKNNKYSVNSNKSLKSKQKSIKTKPQSLKKYFIASQESITEIQQQESYQIKQSKKKYQSQYIADKQQCAKSNYSHLQQQLQIHSISTIYLQDQQQSVNLNKDGIRRCQQQDSFYMDIIVKQDSMKDIIKRQKNNLNILTQSNYNLAQQLQRKNKIIVQLNDKIKKLQQRLLIQNKK